MSSPDLAAIARRLAGSARAGEQVEAYVTRSRDTDIRVFGGDVESLSVAEIDGVGVRVVVDRRQGYAWAGTLDASAVDDALTEARDNAGFGEPDEWNGLAAPADVGGAEPVALDVWAGELAGVPTDDKVGLALELERVTRAADERVRGVESASYGDSAVEVAVANSLGVAAQWRRTLCSCASFAMADDGAATQTGFGVSAARAPSGLDADAAGRDAAERAVRMLGATQPSTRRLPVVLDPHVTRSLLALVGSALGGEAVLKGRSMFAGRQGEEVGAGTVTVVDDPTQLDSFGAATFDSEGVPTRRTTLIEDGRLTRFLHNVYTARRADATTTGSAVRGFKSTPGVGARALHLDPGTRSPDEIIASLPEALSVQSVSGLHSGTNPVSGDFSVGAEGRMVRDGALAEPVRELTIASTLQRILLDVTEVGDDVLWLPGGAAGVTVLIGEMTMSGA